jgi:hypothetical protein
MKLSEQARVSSRFSLRMCSKRRVEPGINDLSMITENALLTRKSAALRSKLQVDGMWPHFTLLIEVQQRYGATLLSRPRLQLFKGFSSIAP